MNTIVWFLYGGTFHLLLEFINRLVDIVTNWFPGRPPVSIINELHLIGKTK